MKSTKQILAAGAAFTAAMIAGTTYAGTISVGFQEVVASEEYDAVSSDYGASTPGRYYHVSVNPNNAGYASYIALQATPTATLGAAIPAYSRHFSDPVVAWSFFGGNKSTATAPASIGISEEGGGLISWTTSDDVFDAFGQNQIKFWNATDPGTNIGLPADEAGVAATTNDKNVNGYRSFGQATGTIDVSGLASGTANIFYGAFSAVPEVSVILRDTDGSAPDIEISDIHLNGAYANRTEFYVAEVDFSTAGGYDTIIYNYAQGSGNGRAGGIVLTGVVPEPSSLALLALGGLMIAKRRRA